MECNIEAYDGTASRHLAVKTSNERGPQIQSASTHLSNKNTVLGGDKNVNCKRNTAYDGVTAKVKVPTVKSHSGTTKNKATSSSLSHVVCKEYEAYGGVAAGYKVIREVTLSLQEMSDSSSVCVSSNQAYKLSKTVTREDSRE